MFSLEQELQMHFSFEKNAKADLDKNCSRIVDVLSI
jgi:hypothetical protein